MYYPAGFWHQTENLDDENIAFSTTLVDQNNFAAVEYEMQQECSGKGQRFAFSPEVCKVMKEVTFPWWHSAFVGDFSLEPRGCPLADSLAS